MPEEKWKCAQCGYEGNAGKFCNRCGSPKGDIHLDNSAETDLAGCVLTDFIWSTHVSGMMAYSGEHYVLEIKWDENGDGRLTYTEEKQYESKKEYVYRVDPEDTEKLLDLLLKFEVPSWTKYKFDYNLGPLVMDRSVSNNLNLSVKNETDGRMTQFSIDLEGVKQQGRAEQIKQISGLLDTMLNDSNLISSNEEVLTMPNGMSKKVYFESMFKKNDVPSDAPAGPADGGSTEKTSDAEPGPGEWKCPLCGTINTGKFCFECGGPRV